MVASAAAKRSAAKARGKAAAAKNEQSADSNAECKIQADLDALRAEKSKAVKNENYKLALELKKREQALLAQLQPGVLEALEKVQAEKNKAVATEDFEKAIELRGKEKELQAKLQGCDGISGESSKAVAKEETVAKDSPGEVSTSTSEMAIGSCVRLLQGEFKGMEGKVQDVVRGWWQILLVNNHRVSFRRDKIELARKAPAANVDPNDKAAASGEPSATAAKAAAGSRPSSARGGQGVKVGKTAQSLIRKKSEEKAPATGAQVDSAPAAKKAKTEQQSAESPPSADSASSTVSGSGKFASFFAASRKGGAQDSNSTTSAPETTPEKSTRPSTGGSSVKEPARKGPKKKLSLAGAGKEEAKQENGADAETKDVSGEVATADHGADEVFDSKETCRRILSELFPLKPRASFLEPEDDAEIMPANVIERVRKRSRRSSTEAEEGDDDKMEDDNEERQIRKAAFSMIENAPNEDFGRFPNVAASFRSYLIGTVGLDDTQADERIKAFYELFQQDGKSIAAMASEPYARLVEDRPMEAETVEHFQKCWAEISNGPFAEAPPREEHGQEIRLRSAHGIPDDWGVRVWLRAHLEALVILTSPDGEKHFAIESEVGSLPIVIDENGPFAKERERRQKLSGQELEMEQQRRTAAQQRAQQRVRDQTSATKTKEALEETKAELSRCLSEFLSISDKTSDIAGGPDEEKKVSEAGGEKKVGEADGEKKVGEADEEKKVSEADEEMKVDAADGEKKVGEADEEKKVSEADEEMKVSEADEEKKVSGADEEKKVSGADQEKKVLRLLHRSMWSCGNCGSAPRHELDDEFKGDVTAEDVAKQAQWNSFDDMPEATDEEKEQYHLLLASFHYAGFEYVTGLRKLMELHKKRPIDMATPAYKRLVSRDPENAQCNGFLNSAVLYFIKFREEGGFERLKTQEEFDQLPANEQYKFTPDYDRAWAAEQVGWDDLQIEIPLELMMMDATEAWHKELLEKLDGDRFITEDIDASGYQAKALSISQLPNATPEDWLRWPRILAKFERVMKEQSTEPTAVKRETEASNHFLVLKELVEEHGKGPDTMSSRRFVRIVNSVYNKTSSSIHGKYKAIQRFAEFWEEHKDGEFPEPKVHAFSKDKYTLVEQERVEAARKVANDWDLPQGWTVKLKKDGTLLKVCGPGKDEFFRSLKEAREKATERAKKQAEEEKAIEAEWEARRDARLRLGAKQVREALDAGDYAKAESLQQQIDEDGEDACETAEVPEVPEVPEEEAQGARTNNALRSKPGAMPRFVRGNKNGLLKRKGLMPCARKGMMPKIDRSSKGGGKGGGSNMGKRKAGELNMQEQLMQVPLKVRKSRGLGVQQQHQAATCQLTLKAHEWRVLGVRVGNEIVPLGSIDLDKMAIHDVRLVLAYVFEDVREQKKRRIVETWKLDDNYKVNLRVRLSGDQVTVIRLSDGKHFTSHGQYFKEQHDIQMRKERAEAADFMQRLMDFLKIVQQEPIWELDVGSLSGFYRKVADGTTTRFQRIWGRSTADSCTAITISQTVDGDAWEFLAEGDQRVLARIAGPTSDPFAATQLQHLAQNAEEASEDLAMTGELLSLDRLLTRLADTVTCSRVDNCRRCTRFSRLSAASCGLGRPSAGLSLGREERQAQMDRTIEELASRRQQAPSTMLGIIEHMLSKLPKMLGKEELPETLRGNKGFRIGTMCSGTDAPVIVAKTLQKALDRRGSEFSVDHVFSVEMDPAKQEFLRANFPECSLMFQDVCQMGRARAYDVLSQKAQAIPGDLDLLIAGFSCKDLSLMNSYRKTLMEMGQSGATLRGVLNYVDRYHPRLVLLENVWAICKANTLGFRQVDLVIEGLKARGYAAGYNLCNSCDFYLPQIRHRIWMWAVRIDDVALNAKASAEEIEARTKEATIGIKGKMTALLQGLEEPCALHFDDLLLDDDHPAVRSHINDVKSKTRKSVTQKRAGVKRDWQSKYAEHRKDHDYQFDAPYTSVRDEEFLEVINKREKELLDLKCLDVLSEQGIDPRVTSMLWELTQSVERVPGTRVRRDRQNYATCILPGMLWHSSRHRWVLGIEKLALQGIFASDLKDTDFPHKLLGDLAGNAFTTSVCAANLIAVLICAADVKKRFSRCLDA